MSKNYDELDDAAARALYTLVNRKNEHMGALYNSAEGIKATDTIVGTGENVKGKLTVPSGSLAALFHNHPELQDMKNAKEDTGAHYFSRDDRLQAQRLNKPSYITTPEGRVRRYVPNEGESDVLAMFPIDQIRQLAMQELLDGKGGK